MCQCVCKCVCQCMCMYVCMCVCECVCMYVCECVCMCVCECVCQETIDLLTLHPVPPSFLPPPPVVPLHRVRCDCGRDYNKHRDFVTSHHTRHTSLLLYPIPVTLSVLLLGVITRGVQSQPHPVIYRRLLLSKVFGEK